jgi:PIN domain nuclease of toxin-antitoxin system
VGFGKVILLDTHVILWLALEPEKVSKSASIAVREIGAAGAGIGISSVSLYEIARLAERSRVKLDLPIETFLRRVESHFLVRQVTVPIATAAGQLPDHFPGDPMDRIIAATALTEGMALVTADERIRRSAVVKTIW